jgi:hypothetical protein
MSSIGFCPDKPPGQTALEKYYCLIFQNGRAEKAL